MLYGKIIIVITIWSFVVVCKVQFICECEYLFVKVNIFSKSCDKYFSILEG